MNMDYKKRDGTSGISGHLYETKLISLILFRLLRDDSVEEFYLASNMDGVGDFDDICLKIKMKGDDRFKCVFVQAKHKDNNNKHFSLHNEKDLIKWADSIQNIKQKFCNNNKDNLMFDGKFENTECLFILYTNAKYQSNEEIKSSFAMSLKRWIVTAPVTGNILFQLPCAENYKEFEGTILKVEISTLAKQFAKFLGNKSNQMYMMNDEYIQRYHTLLAKSVVYVSKVLSDVKKPDNKWRVLTFREDFFQTKDSNLVSFRNYLCEQIVKNEVLSKKKCKVEKSADDLISSFLSNPSVITLRPLITSHVTYINNKLQFVTERPSADSQRLEDINNSSFTINEAEPILRSIKINVPITFGNVDLTVKDKNLNLLTDLIVKLCKTYEQSKLVIVDDTTDVRILRTNHGLNSGIGNILINDKHTKLYKFSNTYTSQRNNAKKIFLKLKKEIHNWHEYRFAIQTNKFPTITFDCSNIVRDFLSKLVVCANQSDHFEVEYILKDEIQKFNDKTKLNNIAVNADAIYQCYHGLIQNWWISPKTRPFLTKECDATIYHQAIRNILQEPQMYALQNMFYNNKIKDNQYRFNNEKSKLESFQNYSRIIIATDITTLTTMKVIQVLEENEKLKEALLIDLELILNLSTQDLSTLITELNDTAKMLIIVCNMLNTQRTLHIRLNKLAEATETKAIIVITNKEIAETVQDYFTPVDKLIFEDEQRLSDLTPDSQKDVLRNAHVIFQDHEVSLNLLIGDSIEFIKGSILEKVIRNETLVIGKSLNNKNYQKIGNLYVERQIKHRTCGDCIKNNHINYGQFIKTFLDIDDDAVLLTAGPGLGKSTLLTYLSLKTKENYKTFWIVRINLLDYSKQFCEWEENRTTIDCIEALTFLCKVVMNDDSIPIRLKEINNKVHLDSCGDDELGTFQLNVFLHSYNERRLILLFDGFDEICPHYKQKVIDFFLAVRLCPQKNKIWVTSRPYTEILPDLQSVMDKTYELQYFIDAEQNRYLLQFWQAKLRFVQINNVLLNNLKSFVNFMSEVVIKIDNSNLEDLGFHKIYFLLFNYIRKSLLKNDEPHVSDLRKLLPSHDMGTDYWDPFSASNFWRDQDTFMGAPLVLYLLADYLASLINADIITTKWELNINKYTMYKMFIETMLKNILFQDKNKMNIYNPDLIRRYEKDRRDCIAMHKKLAIYALVGYPLFKGVCSKEITGMDPFKNDTEFEDLINTVKTGAEKSGLITHVTLDKIPVFIHKTFTEYFAAEYVSDILISDEFDFDGKKLLYVGLGVFGWYEVYDWISERCRTDEKLDDIVKRIHEKTFYNCSWFRNLVTLGKFSGELIMKLLSSSPEDYESDCFNGFDDDQYMKLWTTKGAGHATEYIRQFLDVITTKMKAEYKNKMSIDFNTGIDAIPIHRIRTNM